MGFIKYIYIIYLLIIPIFADNYNFITYQNPPYAFCQDSTQLSGIEIEYTKILQTYLSNDGINSTIICDNASSPTLKSFIENITAYGDKTIGFLGISTYESYLSNARISYPTIDSGLGLLVYLPTRNKNSDISTVFEWRIWLCVAVSYLCYTILIYFVEKDFNQDFHYLREAPREGRKFSCQSLLQGIFYGILVGRAIFMKPIITLEGRLLTIGFLLFNFVISTYFISHIAFSQQNQYVFISQADDLYGMKVLTSKNFIKYIAPFNPFIIDNDIKKLSTDEVANYLTNDKADAIVYDMNYLNYITGHSCNTYIAEDIFKFGIVYVFSNGFSQLEIETINSYILEIGAKKKSLVFNNVYLQNCDHNPEFNVVFGLENFPGLWIFLGTCVAISIVLRLIPHPMFKPQSTLQQKMNKLSKVKARSQKKTVQLLKITSKLMKNNEELLSSCVNDIQKSIDENQQHENDMKNYLKMFKEILNS